MSEALAKIEASRTRLRLAMMPPPPSEPGAAARPGESLLQKLGALPLINAVIESVSAWWSHHPMRPVAHIANEASNAVVKPIAQRNPWSLVLAAGVFGAGLAWTRPWRWMFRSALFAGLVPQLTARVAASLPIESWMSMVAAAVSQRRPGRAGRAERAETPSA